MDAIRVSVIKWGKRSIYYMQYRDPVTGKIADRRTTGIPAVAKRRKDALRVAATWEAELNSASYARPSVDLSWEDWRDRCDREYMPTVEEKTRKCYATALNAFERIVGKPKRMSLVDYQLLAKFATDLRNPPKKTVPKGREAGTAKSNTAAKKKRKMGRPTKDHVSEATIASYLRGLSAVFRWAVEARYLRVMPTMPKTRGRKRSGVKMKGRPLVKEEFERMLTAIPGVVGKKAVRGWRRLLIGLWWSGLRLGEAIHLYWEPFPSDRRAIVISDDGKHPMLLIRGQAQKSGKDQLYPMAPEFWRFLDRHWTAEERRGRVFRLTSMKGRKVTSLEETSKVISRIGKAAGIIVDAAKKKFASAHDLRRSFGLRWAGRPNVSPQLLKELMRHADVATTMSYYVGSLADTTAAVIWRAYEREKAERGVTQDVTQPKKKRPKPE